MWRASTRSWVPEIRRYRNRVSSSFLHFFHRRPVSSGFESAINACILTPFGLDGECCTACVGNACVGEAGTSGVPSSVSDVLVAKYYKENRLDLFHKTASLSVNMRLGSYPWSYYKNLKEKQMPGSLNKITADLSWTLQLVPSLSNHHNRKPAAYSEHVHSISEISSVNSMTLMRAMNDRLLIEVLARVLLHTRRDRALRPWWAWNGDLRI